MQKLKGRKVEKQEYVNARMFDEKVIQKLIIFVPMKD